MCKQCLPTQHLSYPTSDTPLPASAYALKRYHLENSPPNPSLLTAPMFYLYNSTLLYLFINLPSYSISLQTEHGRTIGDAGEAKL